MSVFLMVIGGAFALAVIAEQSEKRQKHVLAGFAICVIGLIALQIL